MRVIASQGQTMVAAGQGDVELPCVSVSTSQPALAASAWEIRVEARLRGTQAIFRELGGVETIPPSDGGRPSKAVLLAGIPGAVEWVARVSRVAVHRDGASLPEDEFIDVDVSASMHGGCSHGLWCCPGESREVRNRYAILSGTIPVGGANVVIPASRLIHTVSAYTNDVGGQLTWLGQTVVLPQFGSLQLAPRGTYQGPTTLVFAGFPAAGGGYVIEVST